MAYSSGVADPARQSGAETRLQIVEAATALLEERGAAGLNVSAIMQRARVSRTAFYRQFDDVYGAAAEILEAIVSELGGAWLSGVSLSDRLGRSTSRSVAMSGVKSLTTCPPA